MSFDVWFFKFAKGESAGLPRERVLEVIHAHAFKEVSDGFYNVRLPDGSEVEVSADDKDHPENPSSVVFWIRGMSDEIIKLAFDMAKATGCIMIPTMDKNPCIMVDVSQRAELPADFDLPQVECGSWEELSRLISGGYAQWERYRDYVIGKANSPKLSPVPEGTRWPSGDSIVLAVLPMTKDDLAARIGLPLLEGVEDGLGGFAAIGGRLTSGADVEFVCYSLMPQEVLMRVDKSNQYSAAVLDEALQAVGLSRADVRVSPEVKG
jgi:hypothetical protein